MSLLHKTYLYAHTQKWTDLFLQTVPDHPIYLLDTSSQVLLEQQGWILGFNFGLNVCLAYHPTITTGNPHSWCGWTGTLKIQFRPYQMTKYTWKKLWQRLSYKYWYGMLAQVFSFHKTWILVWACLSFQHEVTLGLLFHCTADEIIFSEERKKNHTKIIICI